MCGGDRYPTRQNRTMVFRPAKKRCELSAKNATSSSPCIVLEGVSIPDNGVAELGVTEGTS